MLLMSVAVPLKLKVAKLLAVLAIPQSTLVITSPGAVHAPKLKPVTVEKLDSTKEFETA